MLISTIKKSKKVQEKNQKIEIQKELDFKNQNFTEFHEALTQQVKLNFNKRVLFPKDYFSFKKDLKIESILISNGQINIKFNDNLEKIISIEKFN